MKKKLNFKSISKILSIMIVFSMLFPALNVFAKTSDEKYSVTFKLNRHENKESPASSERFFYYWHLSKEEYSEEKALKEAQRFSKMSIDDIKKEIKRGNGVTAKSQKVNDDYETITVDGLVKGSFLFIEPEESYTGQNRKINAQVLVFPRDNKKEVDPKQSLTTPTTTVTKLVKVNESGQVLSGVEFEFYARNSSGNKKFFYLSGNNGNFKYDESKTTQLAPKVLTNSNGEINISDLPNPGNGFYYVFKETKALNEYILDESEYRVEKNESVKVVNKKQPPNDGGYNFIKVDSNNDTVRLQGARFKVMKRADDGRLTDVVKDGRVYTVTSDSKGNFKVEGLPFGNYTLMEVYAPEGYRLSTQAHNFTVSGNSGTSQALIIENRRETEKPPTPPHENPPPTKPPTENPPTPPHENPPGPPNENPPGPPTENPPSPPTENPPRTRGPLPKTGDTAIYFAVAFGLVLVFKGTRMVKFN